MFAEFSSAIYQGTVRHRRYSPKKHDFSYRVFMMYLDTQELDKVLSLSPFWSTSRWAPARFKRDDFHKNKNVTGNPDTSIDEAVRNTVELETGTRPNGPIRMLVNLRYWGYSINPLSTYYCFDKSGEDIIAIVAEVHNTPWNERHAYVLTGDDFNKNQSSAFEKKFHVSPFNPVDMIYRWKSTIPTDTLCIHLENWQKNTKVMDATMILKHQPINAKNLNDILIHFPWMTVKVVMAIYWQALKLWLKGVPTFNHGK
ncbi:MAG: DUF1365 domain-containing protein [Pseudomonadota bacterium]